MHVRAAVFRRIIAWLVSFIVALGLWELFVATGEPNEAYVGVAAAAATLAISEIVRHQEQPRFWAHARWFLQLWRIPGDILTGCKTAVFAMFRGEEGLLHEVPFDPGGDDSESAGRRALAIAFTSISPNAFIINIDRKRCMMLIHMADHGRVPEVARYFGSTR